MRSYAPCEGQGESAYNQVVQQVVALYPKQHRTHMRFLSKLVVSVRRHPRYAYWLRACFSALHCDYLLKFMPETLPNEQRRPWTGFENPFRCFRVMAMCATSNSLSSLSCPGFGRVGAICDLRRALRQDRAPVAIVRVLPR